MPGIYHSQLKTYYIQLRTYYIHYDWCTDVDSNDCKDSHQEYVDVLHSAGMISKTKVCREATTIPPTGPNAD